MSAFGGGNGGSAESLGGLGGLLTGGGIGGILSSILGAHHSTVEDGVQQASGLDRGKAGKLLILLAPFIIRSLAKHQSAAGQNNGGLAGSLQQSATTAMNSAPSSPIGGILGRILGGLTG